MNNLCMSDLIGIQARQVLEPSTTPNFSSSSSCEIVEDYVDKSWPTTFHTITTKDVEGC